VTTQLTMAMHSAILSGELAHHADVCERHHRGNDCSKAANRVTDKAAGQERILNYLSTVKDSTCDEAEQQLGMSHQTCSARFSELKRDGKIIPTVKRPTRGGCDAQAFRIL